MKAMATSAQPHSGRYYMLGLGLGFIPALAEWLGGLLTCPNFLALPHPCSGLQNAGLSNFFFGAGFWLYGISILAIFVSFFASAGGDAGSRVGSLRFVGYGLLTMVFVAPIVAVFGCLVVSSATHSG